MSDLDRTKQAEEIVKALAAFPTELWVREYECPMCYASDYDGQVFADDLPVERHEPECPYRRAVEWVNGSRD